MFQGHKTTLRQKIAIANLSWQLSYGKKAHISDQSEHHLKNSCYLHTHIETTYFQTICNKGTDVIVLDTHPLDHGDSPFCPVSLSCLIGGSLILRPLVGFSRSGMLQMKMRWESEVGTAVLTAPDPSELCWLAVSSNKVSAPARWPSP